MLKLWKWIVPVGLLGYVYFPSFVWLYDRWIARDSYFAHGFLIPAISIYWIWKKRKELAAPAPEVEWRALPVVLLAVLIQAGSSVLRIYFASCFSFVSLVLAGAWFLLGRRIFRLVWYPMAFLYLMIPLPLLVISEFTLKMKFLVSQIAVFLLPHAGIQAVREGSYILTPHAAVLIGDPCSGLRSFIAFLCLGLVFAYDTKMALWKRSVLVLAGIPLAILSNVVRVFTLAFLSEIYGTKAVIESWFHDFSGYAVFLMAFAAFLWLRKKLEVARD